MTLSIESLRGKLSKVGIPSRVKEQFAVRRFASFFLITTLLPVSFAPVNIVSENVENSEPVSIEFTLDTTKSSLLASTHKVSTVVPGESSVERIAREKTEAEAKARAEAQAKADAEAKAKQSASRSTVTRERRVYSDPSNFGEIYARAEAASGVDARLLRAVHQVETGGSGSTNRKSYAGAQGPMQFLPSTWARHGKDGNGDGVADINNVEDAIFSAAFYLKACGYPNVKKALWGYNPSTSYYNKVMNLAHSYGM